MFPIESLVWQVYLHRIVQEGQQGRAVDESSISDVIDHPEYYNKKLGK